MSLLYCKLASQPKWPGPLKIAIAKHYEPEVKVRISRLGWRSVHRAKREYVNVESSSVTTRNVKCTIERRDTRNLDRPMYSGNNDLNRREDVGTVAGWNI